MNWCPALGTVLANEEVQDGKSERGGHPVKRIPLRQWMLRITSYAERLLDGLEDLDWPVGIKKLQQDWIGRSTGAEVDFCVGDEAAYAAWTKPRKASGFPDRPDQACLANLHDTARYVVRCDLHGRFTRASNDRGFDDGRRNRLRSKTYCEKASFKSDRERTEGDRAKTGVFTGSHAINPVNNQPIPIWVADYVLAGYGTGAIMAVPAHDDRDFEFAKQFDLPIIPVVDPPADHPNRDAILAGDFCFVAKGNAINSGPFDGQSTDAVKTAVTHSLNDQGLGSEAVNYKLRDWLFSSAKVLGRTVPGASRA